MAKKEEIIEEGAVEETVEEEKGPRVPHNFGRDDLNDLRDAVNELHARG